MLLTADDDIHLADVGSAAGIGEKFTVAVEVFYKFLEDAGMPEAGVVSE